jgi:uncharacterized protein (DUF1800 family)
MSRSPDVSDPSRRAFLKLGSLAAASAAAPTLPTVAAAQQPTRAAAQPPKRLRGRQLPRRFAGVNQADQPSWIVEPTDSWFTFPIRLARRVTLGVTTEETRQAIELGYFGYLDWQLEYDRIDDAAAEDFVAAKYPLLAQGTTQTYNVSIETVIQQLQDATLYRAAFSKRQLYQRMVEFWSDHFTIYVRKVGYLKLIDDRDVIRKHALGKFPELLRASAKSPGMLVYLDQQSSRRGAPNQNYARELMELHTLGVDGGYTQQDVAEVSRALTGWTTQGRGDFAFNPSLHDFDAKTILGHTIPARPTSTGAAGIQDGEMVLDWLVAHPSTARFIARKMLRFLLWYDPSEEMIDNVAGVYASTGGDIKSMVRACLDPSYLVQAPAKLKRPFHFLVSALRGLEPTATTVTAMSRQLTTLGQPLFMWETPDGYPDQVEYWAGNLLPRWNVATTLANLTGAEIGIDVAPLTRMNSADAVVYEISRRLFGGELNERTRQELIAYLKPAPANATRVRETLALALASSEFQWY